MFRKTNDEFSNFTRQTSCRQNHGAPQRVRVHILPFTPFRKNALVPYLTYNLTDTLVATHTPSPTHSNVPTLTSVLQQNLWRQQVVPTVMLPSPTSGCYHRKHGARAGSSRRGITCPLTRTTTLSTTSLPSTVTPTLRPTATGTSTPTGNLNRTREELFVQPLVLELHTAVNSFFVTSSKDQYL